MEIDSVLSDTPKRTGPAQPPRDPLIRYSVFAALGCAGVCMVFALLYIFSYSLDSTLSFERHFDAYLTSGNTGNLSTVLGLHMAQNRMFLQSCGMVAGIFFAFLGLALFLVGIQGSTDATGQIRDHAASLKRLIPGGVILLFSMVFVGVSAMHSVDFTAVPTGATAPATTPIATAAPPALTPPTDPPATQSNTAPTLQPAPQTSLTPSPATPAPATSAQTTPQPVAPQPAQHPTATIQQPTPHPTLASVNRPTPAHLPAVHRFQP
jgi:hypothetical protein